MRSFIGLAVRGHAADEPYPDPEPGHEVRDHQGGVADANERRVQPGDDHDEQRDRQEPAHRMRDYQRVGEHPRPTEIPCHGGRADGKEQGELVGAHRAHERRECADGAGQGTRAAQAPFETQHQAKNCHGEGQARPRAGWRT